jgi:hypothetical protein
MRKFPTMGSVDSEFIERLGRRYSQSGIGGEVARCTFQVESIVMEGQFQLTISESSEIMKLAIR